MTTSNHNGPRPRLSVAMIVRNEQDVLAESIHSVRSFADEIVVLDTGSTDQTPAIAQQLGAVVRHTAWRQDFSAARNTCLQYVSGDWVLWLDAGEWITDDSSGALRDFVDKEAHPSNAYMLWIETPPQQASASGEQAACIRLMPNRRELKFQGRVRETLEPALKTSRMAVEMSPGRIIRHPRQHDREVKISKAQRNIELACQENAERHEPPSPRLLLALGEAYDILGLHKQAWGVFRNVIDIAPKGSAEMLEAYYGMLTVLDNVPFPHAQQMSVCVEAMEIYPFDAQLMVALGNYLHCQRQFELAAKAFDTAIHYGQVNPTIWHLTDLTAVATACLHRSMQSAARENALSVRFRPAKAA
jgi:tetratricopeptide (TPR) repeat protein